MMWQSPNGCAIRAAREEWLANLTCLNFNFLNHFLNRSLLAPYWGGGICLNTVDNALFKNSLQHHRASKRESLSQQNLQIFLQE
jgi:hypothetical protein